MTNTLTLLRKRLDHPLPRMYAIILGCMLFFGSVGVGLSVLGMFPAGDVEFQEAPTEPVFPFNYIPEVVATGIVLAMIAVAVPVFIWMHYAWLTGKWDPE